MSSAPPPAKVRKTGGDGKEEKQRPVVQLLKQQVPLTLRMQEGGDKMVVVFFGKLTAEAVSTFNSIQAKGYPPLEYKFVSPATFFPGPYNDSEDGHWKLTQEWKATDAQVLQTLTTWVRAWCKNYDQPFPFRLNTVDLAPVDGVRRVDLVFGTNHQLRFYNGTLNSHDREVADYLAGVGPTMDNWWLTSLCGHLLTQLSRWQRFWMGPAIIDEGLWSEYPNVQQAHCWDILSSEPMLPGDQTTLAAKFARFLRVTWDWRPTVMSRRHKGDDAEAKAMAAKFSNDIQFVQAVLRGEGEFLDAPRLFRLLAFSDKDPPQTDDTHWWFDTARRTWEIHRTRRGKWSENSLSWAGIANARYFPLKCILSYIKLYYPRGSARIYVARQPSFPALNWTKVFTDQDKARIASFHPTVEAVNTWLLSKWRVPGHAPYPLTLSERSAGFVAGRVKLLRG